MAFWDDAKKKMLQAMKPRQQEGPQVVSNRADGGFSGYVPKMPDPQSEMAKGYQTGKIQNMMPTGVDASAMHFRNAGGTTGPNPAAGQPGQYFNQGMNPQPGMPQQAPNSYFPPQNPPRPQAQFNGPQMSGPQPVAPQQMGAQPFPHSGPQPVQQSFAPGFEPNQPPRGFTTQQPPIQPAPSNTVAFPGDSYVVDGNAYKLVFRVAQITGVPSCFRVIEFMYNNEAVIVNAEQVHDLVEADRCMDLIFGAACAMKQRLMRVSGKQIYLITPPQVYVAPFDSLRRAGMADIERRWPGAMQGGMQPQQVVNNVQQMSQFQPMGADYGQPRQDDFAGFGRRAARNAAPANGYTDYGGFGMKGR